jgi:hypothetical protein
MVITEGNNVAYLAEELCQGQKVPGSIPDGDNGFFQLI